ncbi:TRAP transporter large permease subunit [Vibrio sp. SS-MA-C1-2]|uniref:Na+/H+ antiporter family protein n=1 Tax=Vibrio sp. SS-MA-C1-2 TaxID=2908646 RepID=UPI001F159429|nr:Na+/H+ antiporter NhaC family protein [Vibrio sp. SS-MA-C1-2]UJF17943.1 TRAP transporter large permease subunit [Vibrio sp. SS-MA-C1-2]
MAQANLSTSTPNTETSLTLKIAIICTAFISLLAIVQPSVLPVNSVILSIALMIAMCLIRMPVAVALIAAAMVGAIHSGMTAHQAIGAVNENLASGAQVGMTYIMIGAFAVALARSGLLDLLAKKCTNTVNNNQSIKSIKWLLFTLFIIASVMSQNIIPVHIAFIPVMIPPLLVIFNKLHIDRRAVACIIACSISVSYLLLPTGFGAIYLFEILLPNVNATAAEFNVSITTDQVPQAMFLPVMGIVAGMFVAVFFSYRKPRQYDTQKTEQLVVNNHEAKLNFKELFFVLAAIAVALIFQVKFDSLLLGSMVGFILLTLSGVFNWKQQDDVFTEGMRMMVQIAVIITIAAGFAGVLTATGSIPSLVESTAELIGHNKAIAALLMLLVGLFITIGFGDSFASVPILAPIYVPLALSLGFSPAATIALLGASAALGDAGSPASTISLGVTSGLNADGQHDHIRDSVIPTFTHANFGMVIFAWAAALIL